MRATVLFLAIAVGLASAQNFSYDYSEGLMAAFRASQRNNLSYLRFEWEGYDGWYNNPAHPDWGGAGKCMHTQLKKQTVNVMLLHHCFICRYALGKEDACSLP